MMIASPANLSVERIRVDFFIDDEAVASAIPMNGPHLIATAADCKSVEEVDVFRQGFPNMKECFAETGQFRRTLASQSSS
ncbi:hypothetical protein [Rhodopirellula bahusiensis]|uniref:hypothetical protein n=1 Tax=Rhodopirellula bahusiensis TaxID=2014065 RepID=UPI0032635C5F